MTLDAMHWVWNHSRSKGNARLALLYVADQVRTTACEVRVGQRELMAALNAASKGTAEAALKTAVVLGELEIVEGSSGRRPALYRLPKAVGYTRSATNSAPESGAQDSASAPESRAQSKKKAPRSAPKTGARGSACAPDFDASAPKTGAPPHTQKEHASGQEEPLDAFTICQPLIQAMTDAGLVVSWQMQTDDWKAIARVVQRAGVEAMVEHALGVKAREPIRWARFYLKAGWLGLPPKSTRDPIPSQRNPRADWPAWCKDPDCDEQTRFRDHETDTGHRVSVPCPTCHPNRKAPAA